MLRLVSAIAVLLFLNLSYLIHPVHAAAPPGQTNQVRVMIQLKGSPLAADMNLKTRDRATLYRYRIDPTLASARGYAVAMERYQQQELAFLRSRGIAVQPIRQFHLLFNGFSALVPRNQLPRLQTLTDVAAVLPDRMIRPMDERSIALINAPQAWNFLGGPADAGRGLYIADVDTGIDMTNACFKDSGIPAPAIARRADTPQNYALTNNKVPVIRAFGSYPNQKYSAVDVIGHGTFTAAIEACDYNTPTPLGAKISGVAPAAYLMVYNINPEKDDGGGPVDSAVAAFEAALQDGADVLNFSYGSIQGAGDENLDPEVQAVNLASKAGLTMVVSAGNAGPTANSISSPSTAESAISVGASTNNRSVSEDVTVLGPGTVPTALQQIRAVEGSHPFTASIGPAQIVDAGYGSADDFAGKDLHGKIALMQRGGKDTPLTFETKVTNAAQAGAVGAIIYDNHYEISPPGMDTGTATLPAMAISQADGIALLAWIKANAAATVVMDPTKRAVAETPDILSDFSSRGYGPDYRIKPDLVAPGQDIYSAAQTDKPGGELYDSSGFAAADGTSFSAPHVTGAVALLLQRHPKWTPAQIKATLMDTASTTALTVPESPTPHVMEVGSGLIDVEAALAANAYLTPASASVGQANVGYGAQQQTVNITLNDLGGGSGAWTTSVQQLHGADGVSVSVPATVQLAAGASSSFALQLSETSAVAPGDYDGYVFLHNGSVTLHVPYFVHVASKAVAPGTVLLVDASTTRFQPGSPTPPIQHLDVSHYYEQALQAIGKPYTYWDDAVQGAPSLTDMKRASSVIYFTGANLNGFAHQNTDPQSLDGPLNAVDMTSIQEYLHAGGRVFMTGMAAALSDEYWSAFVLGADWGGLSEYDNSRNDPKATGGISPPTPSATVDKRQFVPKNPWVFSGLKPIDFSTKGDGAGDNLAVPNSAIGSVFKNSPKLIGVTDLSAFDQSDQFFGAAFGKVVLRTTDVKNDDGSGDVAIVNSDEPTLKHVAKYAGRSVLFSFGFEGINNNTGYATREQVLQRIFQWFGDKPAARVTGNNYAHGRPVRLGAALHAAAGVRAVQYDWQVGGAILKATSKPTSYTFPHAGQFKVRVLITDSLGHSAVSAWRTITVR